MDRGGAGAARDGDETTLSRKRGFVGQPFLRDYRLEPFLKSKRGGPRNCFSRVNGPKIEMGGGNDAYVGTSPVRRGAGSKSVGESGTLGFRRPCEA